ncbi:MAG: hypothetical protein IPG60_11535 [Bacteroidetes bacterium]|nr:hypothetical protein [Bacteroidota bacterium]
MIDVSKHISELLLTNNCVIVPGFGGFVANYQPARIHTASYIFNGPSKSIAFNINLSANDGLLINKIVSSEYVNLFYGDKSMAQFVQEVKTEMKEGRTYKLPKIGILLMDKEGHIQFIPDPSNNFLLQNYGLSAFEAKPVVHKREPILKSLEGTGITNEEIPVIKSGRQFRIIAISTAAILLIAFLIQIFIQVNAQDKNYADILGIDALLHNDVVSTSQYSPGYMRMENYFLKYYRPTTALTDSIPMLTADQIHEAIEVNLNANNNQLIVESKYWVIAGAFGKKEIADLVKDQIYKEGFSVEVIQKNDYFMVAISIPLEINYATYRNQFIDATGITDAWVLKK